MSGRSLLRPFRGVFVFLATVIIFFEEWLWFRLLAVMRSIAALPIFRQIEGFIRAQNKWVSLMLFIIPELAFIPVKMGVLWLMGNNHTFYGVILFITAKIVGTALFAWMYSATEPKITQFRFVCWIRDKIQAIRTWAHDWIQSQEAYHQAKAFIAEIRQRKEHWLARRMRAAKVVAKNEWNGQ